MLRSAPCNFSHRETTTETVRITCKCRGLNFEEGTMYLIADSKKSFEQAATDLEAAVTANKFGVLHVHDLGETLRGKGVDFAEQCKVFEVCNPVQAGKVMSTDMRLNMALPCRISVYTEKGQTKIGMIRPIPMLSSLSDDSALVSVAAEVEKAAMQMIEDAK